MVETSRFTRRKVALVFLNVVGFLNPNGISALFQLRCLLRGQGPIVEAPVDPALLIGLARVHFVDERMPWIIDSRASLLPGCLRLGGDCAQKQDSYDDRDLHDGFHIGERGVLRGILIFLATLQFEQPLS